MDISKFGIYVNASEKKAVRINSPYWIPPAEEWTYLTPEVNMTTAQDTRPCQGKRLVGFP